jgi:hypothetical protein
MTLYSQTETQTTPSLALARRVLRRVAVPKGSADEQIERPELQSLPPPLQRLQPHSPSSRPSGLSWARASSEGTVPATGQVQETCLRRCPRRGCKHERASDLMLSTRAAVGCFSGHVVASPRPAAARAAHLQAGGRAAGGEEAVGRPVQRRVRKWRVERGQLGLGEPSTAGSTTTATVCSIMPPRERRSPWPTAAPASR